jgi:NADPH:quinone reductase-like Zn-dependent oxidoreductase
MMKAWICRRYGSPDVLQLEERPDPVAGDGEILIGVRATTVNSGDARVRGCDFPAGMKTMGRLALGWNGPRQPVLGTELAGEVEAVGQGVTRFRPGDRVFAFPGGKMGAHAELVTLRADGKVAQIPQGIGFDEAAALCFGGTTALHYLRRAELSPGQSILVLGGSGAVGVALIQLAVQRGAIVTATTSTPNLELVGALGARTIDYTTTDPATLDEKFDVVADTVGALDFNRAQLLLKPGGRYLAIAGGIREMLASTRRGPNDTRMISGPAAENADDIVELARLAETGAFRPHIDRVFDFADMPAAHALVDTHRKRGSVVVQL